MPLIGTLTSGSLGAFGLVQQAQIAILKATTAISGSSSFELQQIVNAADGSYLAGTNSSILGTGSFAAHGDYLVTGDGDYQNVYVWNLSDGSLHMIVPAPSPPPQTDGWGWQIDIHGDYFIAGNGSGYTTVHDVSTGALITTITGAARNVAINENYAVSLGLTGSIQIFELATNTLKTFSHPNTGSGERLFDVYGNNLILGFSDGSVVSVHDIPTAFANDNLNTSSPTISPGRWFRSLEAEGNYLAVGGGTTENEQGILIYDLTTGTLLHDLDPPEGIGYSYPGFGNSVQMSGDYLVAGYGRHAHGPVAVYDLTTGTLLQSFTIDDLPDTYSFDAPGNFGSSVAITDSKTIVGIRYHQADGWETGDGQGAFIIYSNPGQVAAPVSSGWSVDLSNVTYDSVSFSVNQDNTPQSIAFNNDGTKMYMMGGFHKNIHQYTLSTGFDLSTALYDNVNFYMGSQDNTPLHMKFNTDGTKMYVNGLQRNKIHQYSLASGFDLSTTSYDNVTFELPAFTYGFTFNNDGTKMYSNGDAGNLRQYSLTTGFDISTASYDNVNFSASQSHSPNDMWFNSDGTKMYILFAGGEDDVHQYSLTTGFDISTISYDNVLFSVGGQENNPTGTAISSDGTKMYVIGGGNDTVYQYSTGL